MLIAQIIMIGSQRMRFKSKESIEVKNVDAKFNERRISKRNKSTEIMKKSSQMNSKSRLSNDKSLSSTSRDRTSFERYADSSKSHIETNRTGNNVNMNLSQLQSNLQKQITHKVYRQMNLEQKSHNLQTGLLSNSLYIANKMSKQEFFDKATSTQNYKLWNKEQERLLFALYEKNKGDFTKIAKSSNWNKIREVETQFYVTLRWIAYEYNKWLYENLKSISTELISETLAKEVEKYYISNPFKAKHTDLLKFFGIALNKLDYYYHNDQLAENASIERNNNRRISDIVVGETIQPAYLKKPVEEKKRIRKENKKKLESILLGNSPRVEEVTQNPNQFRSMFDQDLFRNVKVENSVGVSDFAKLLSSGSFSKLI